MASSGFVLSLQRGTLAAAVVPTSSHRAQRLPLDCSKMPISPTGVSTLGNARIGRRWEGTSTGASTASKAAFLGVAVCLGGRHRRALHRMLAGDAGQADEYLLQGSYNGDAQDVRQWLLSGWTPQIARRQAGANRSTDACKPSPGLPCELQALQGHWEDLTMGFIIDIDGDKANFNDGTSLWKAKLGSDGLSLRGAHFLGGLPDLASWRLPNDREMFWERLDPEIVNETQLHTNFLNYKLARTMLRRRISVTMAQKDFEVADALVECWENGWGFQDETTTPDQELRLRLGCFLVPGACVVHRRFGYRAVVLGCEPWVRAPLARRLSALEREASGTRTYRLQPLYCVLVDDRDVSGGGALFVPETDLEPSKDVFPIQSRHKDRLLEEHETSQAYLPRAMLKQAARRQHLGMPFTLSVKVQSRRIRNE